MSVSAVGGSRSLISLRIPVASSAPVRMTCWHCGGTRLFMPSSNTRSCVYRICLDCTSQFQAYRVARLRLPASFSFLDSLDRVTAPRYVPTNGAFFPCDCDDIDTDAHSDDILRARLKTLGVSEYRFLVKDGA